MERSLWRLIFSSFKSSGGIWPGGTQSQAGLSQIEGVVSVSIRDPPGH